MLIDIYKSYVECAKNLGNYQAISKTALANGYCDADEAGDDIKRSQYLSALMLRYWYKIYEWYKNSSTLRLEIEDYVYWLADAFDLAFKYRRWRDPKDKLYNDPNGPDKVFKKACATIRVRAYYNANLDKRKINYLVDSLDASIEACGDAVENNSKLIEDYSKGSPIKDIIALLIKQNKIIDALIIDGIAFHNSTKVIKTVNKKVNALNEAEKSISYCHSFSQRLLTQHLKEIAGSSGLERKNLISYFENSYDLNTSELDTAFSKITTLSSNQLSNKIKKLLDSIKTDQEYRSILCI